MDSAMTSFFVPDPGANLPPLDPDGLMPLFAAAAHGGRPRLGAPAPNPWAMPHFADRAISPQWLDFPDPLRPPARTRLLPSRATAALAGALLGAVLLLGAGHAAGLLPSRASWHPAASHVRALPLSAAAPVDPAPLAPTPAPVEQSATTVLSLETAAKLDTVAAPARIERVQPQPPRNPGKLKHRPARAQRKHRR